MGPLPTITVYTLPVCVQCKLTKRKLDELGLSYEVADLSAPELADKLADFKARGLLSAPIVVADARHLDGDLAEWSGYRPDLLEALA
ncbi:NrdH-like glutaredoxin [Microbacterium phage Honk]|uniref:NrdH-like glutaredoxin n=1 Tax=Microbacterium phage Honk TaxID=2836095 RepID=A0A8F3INU5_9CAUD|nr:NrdH-like glutaredoxin [Microbacterium phage Honk]